MERRRVIETVGTIILMLFELVVAVWPDDSNDTSPRPGLTLVHPRPKNPDQNREMFVPKE